MPTIEVRDLSEDAYEELERLAFAAGQSVPQYVRALVLRETRHHRGLLAAAGPSERARARRTRQAFADGGGGAASGVARESERWRDL
jgi:hypothetical protein